ncbi:hypothetical protein LQ757_09135 [Agromyces sp. SYSU K20354]|uniref:hypothetical protein n=1 Tax=Agromyces cavernae TaxID=2898659 RepID=UPI001E473487|nr:hypothetical protein [Agromyces cavernae]MCD2442436.1 hypothetical protein [Agromyces cavernae]
MLLRRLFYRWQFIAIIALPVWLLVGWAVFGSGGWGTLGLAIVVPVAFIALGIVALLVNARPTVRAERAVSWIDVGVLGAWHASIIATGFYGSGGAWFAVFAVIGAIAAFWFSLWQLISDGAQRMKASMAEFERLAAQQQGAPGGPAGAGGSSTGGGPDDDGEVIIVHEVRD